MLSTFNESYMFKAFKFALISSVDLLLDIFRRLDDIPKARERFFGLLVILVGGKLYYNHKYSFWSKRNVKTPKPVPILGNTWSYVKKPYQELSLDWMKEFGKIYGLYSGSSPYLILADAKILKQICIKDFDKFTNRILLKNANKYQRNFLTAQKDEQWKSLRSIMSTAFSSGKIKKMFNIMNGTIDKFIDNIKNEFSCCSNEQQQLRVDIRSGSNLISMSSAVESFYGIKLAYGEPDEPNTVQNFSKKSHEAFTPPALRLFVTSLMPLSILRYFDIADIGDGQFDFFFTKAKNIINSRLSSAKNETRNDYLQLLLDAREGDEIDRDVELDKYEEHHALMSNLNDTNTRRLANVRPSKRKLTSVEVSCQVIMLLLVATETTGSLIAHTIYLLAYHPDIQERLAREMSKIRKKNEKREFEYDDITSNEYLDCVISESMRLMPPALYMDRVASEDYLIEEYGIVIPKGTRVQLDYYAIHRNPEYWSEPDKFDPERFNGSNKANIVSGAYCPFGIGPRACIGFRFALTEAKLSVARLISEFEFGIADGTRYPPEPKMPAFIGNESKNLFVTLKPRS